MKALLVLLLLASPVFAQPPATPEEQKVLELIRKEVARELQAQQEAEAKRKLNGALRLIKDVGNNNNKERGLKMLEEIAFRWPETWSGKEATRVLKENGVKVKKAKVPNFSRAGWWTR